MVQKVCVVCQIAIRPGSSLSTELLQAREIIPPESRTSEIDEDDGGENRADQDDSHRLKQEDSDAEDSEAERVAQAKIRQLEEELAVWRDRGKKRAVKREAEGRSAKRMKMEEIHANRFFIQGEVIDLT